MIFSKNMLSEEILIFCKSAFVISFVWLFDGLYLNVVQTSIINENIRELMIELKEVIGFIVSFLVLIITIIKLKKLVKNEKIKEEDKNA